MSLIQLIYVSTSRRELETRELDALLAQSVRNNAAAGVTGMLLYAGGGFIQVLEGEERDVTAIYARIQRDPRHKQIVELDRDPIAERQFAAWHMGFRRLGEREACAHPQYAPFFATGFDAAQLGARPGLALELLLQFRATQRD